MARGLADHLPASSLLNTMDGQKLDVDEILAAEPTLRKGIAGLWLQVFLLSVRELQTGDNSEAARYFIFDPGNFAMDIVAEELDVTPAALRKWTRELIPGAWRDESRKR